MNQKDIARILDVSPSTVSMALRGTGRISNKLKEKVLELSNKHNVAIREIKRAEPPAEISARTVRIGYCGFHERPGWFQSGGFQGMVDQTGTVPHEVLLLMGHADGKAKGEEVSKELEARALEMRLDGLILDPSPAIPGMLKDVRIPKVQVGYFNRHPDWLDAVVVDSLWGGYRLTRELIRKGRKRIACIRCLPGDQNSREKFHGYRMALEEANLPFDASLVFEGDCHYMSGARCANELLELSDPPDAVFLENDWMTPDFVQRLREADRSGFRVLDDLAMAHFCDADNETLLPVEIDRVHLPRAQMGRIATRLLLDRVAGLGTEAVTIKVSPNFRPGGQPRSETDTAWNGH